MPCNLQNFATHAKEGMVANVESWNFACLHEANSLGVCTLVARWKRCSDHALHGFVVRDGCLPL